MPADGGPFQSVRRSRIVRESRCREYRDTTGFNSTVSLGCDTSPGDSGSATYTTSLGSHHAFAIASTEMCSTCTAEPNPETKAHPNLHKRLDQFIVDLIISLRAAYP